MELNLKEIIIGDRIRKDLGDVDNLVESISEIGLLHPVVVKQKGDEYFLLAGRRRLEAFKKLGKETIPVTVVSLEDVLKAELHENTVRKDFTFTEMVALDNEFAPSVKEESKKRMVDAHASSAKLAQLEQGTSRDKMAAYLGMGHSTYDKFQKIKEAIKANPEKFGDFGERIDNGMSIDYAHKMVITKEKSNTPTPDLPEGEFELIYMDPPWKYDLELSGSPDYKTMTVEEMITEIPKIPAHKDCILFMWVTNPKLNDAYRLLQHWGFEYKTKMEWVKMKDGKLQAGTGHYVFGADEMLWICTKGSPGTPPTDARPKSVIFAERTKKHSEKPKIFYQIIETMYPAKKKLEMFSRDAREGWQSWGDGLE